MGNDDTSRTRPQIVTDMGDKLTAVLAGSTGFLGSAILRGLQDQYDFVCLKRDKETHEGDLAVPQPRLPNIPRADVLFHAAGSTLGRIDPQELTQVYSANIQITLNLLAVCQKAKISKIVFASSYIYGHPHYIPIDEKHPIQAITPYMHSKMVCEEILRACGAWMKIDVVSLRLFNIYGPAQRPGLLISDILAQIDQSEILLGDSKPKRDFVYIDDVVSAFDRAARTSIKGWEAINIGSGHSVSVKEIAQTLKRIAGSEAQLRFERPARPAEIEDVVADISKAKGLLNWTPRIDLKEGLRRTLDMRIQSMVSATH